MEMKVANIVSRERPENKSSEIKVNPMAKEQVLDGAQKKADKDLQPLKIADGLDTLANAFNKGIKFQVHEETEQTYVEIVNRETGEVIKQIPPEEMLQIAANLQEFLGFIIDEKA